MIYKQKVQNLIANENFFTQMEIYVNMIEQKNQLMNLTNFAGDQLWRDAIYESLITFSDIKIPNQMLDIGAGAGFPSIPLLIINPKLKLTIVESRHKRIQFLQEVLTTLNLKANLINSRAEDLKTQQFDFITARAVAPLFKLVEISHHLGAVGATFYFIKGASVEAELNDAQLILKKLKINDISLIKKRVAKRVFYIVKYSKTRPTPPGIPRLWSQIKKP